MNTDYQRDPSYDPRKPTCGRRGCTEESLMRWHDTPLCEKHYRKVWPRIRKELRAQQLVIGGLPKEREKA